ncbi:helix-turn-helix transcriptional regulator [Mycolicibacterium holsaticum]|uniref:Transcriptional regulator n=1 Tax=Mycolicibacterium holsaticum TaxID=152142 RepID=A0A1E3RWV8_9MYCO|nr:helix-turn-helix domain-containing protein [Mycolicibacterium holsaticum]MDA4109605.1 transcriptional regulator [Mycolicibacterium holsaticum DSM 44478 = JCM 12374]ODQ93847.1 transcriptional regulator [Mycolicibacterium holsaticum]QZA10542.1 helix-turn-helix domain-containing protein [Mycolicibacterium holsaticum DSM 44478 = JCM 12374]UNC11954.1 helix-turn-helix domain-containing protein [Mycolicibacterium holsaticum DSM 44478 = JCM 12374]
MSEKGDRVAGRREEVLAALRATSEPMTIVAIADGLGVHPNTVRFHLDTLVGDGRAERVEPDRRGPGRPPLMFRAVHRMDPGGPRRYQVLAEILLMSLAGQRNPAAKAASAGRAWARRIAGRDDRTAISANQSARRLVKFLDELGFAPRLRTVSGKQQVGLRHCPFLELAEGGSDVVCPVHLGLMRGALEAWDAPVTVEKLEPFVEPDLCVAHLTASTKSPVASDFVP